MWLRLVGTPKSGPGLNASLVETFKRCDGKQQVTYNGHALLLAWRLVDAT